MCHPFIVSLLFTWVMTASNTYLEWFLHCRTIFLPIFLGEQSVLLSLLKKRNRIEYVQVLSKYWLLAEKWDLSHLWAHNSFNWINAECDAVFLWKAAPSSELNMSWLSSALITPKEKKLPSCWNCAKMCVLIGLIKTCSSAEGEFG